MQKFKFSHMVALYEKGIYALTADDGYVLQNKKTGETVKSVKTKDYTQWETIEGNLLTPEQEAEANKKALATLGTIFEIAHDQNKLSEEDERLQALDAKLREQGYDPDSEENVPPIDTVTAGLREVGLGEFADAFDLAWADKEFVHIIDAMPELPADNEGEGEGEGVKPADEETPAEDVKPAEEEKPAEEYPKDAAEDVKPADEQPAETPAEEKPKTTKKKAAADK